VKDPIHARYDPTYLAVRDKLVGEPEREREPRERSFAAWLKPEVSEVEIQARKARALSSKVRAVRPDGSKAPLRKGADRFVAHTRRFWEKVAPDPETGCWNWTAATSGGYGVVSSMLLTGDPQPLRAHRWAYLIFVGPLDPGKHIHHVCGNKRCCNPAHLEALSPRSHSLTHAISGMDDAEVRRFVDAAMEVQETLGRLNLVRTAYPTRVLDSGDF
jgi:hypothetical protein